MLGWNDIILRFSTWIVFNVGDEAGRKVKAYFLYTLLNMN